MWVGGCGSSVPSRAGMRAVGLLSGGRQDCSWRRACALTAVLHLCQPCQTSPRWHPVQRTHQLTGFSHGVLLGSGTRAATGRSERQGTSRAVATSLVPMSWRARDSPRDETRCVAGRCTAPVCPGQESRRPAVCRAVRTLAAAPTKYPLFDTARRTALQPLLAASF